MRLLLLMSVVLLFSGCYTHFHKEAIYDRNDARTIINQLKDGPLIYIQNTDYRKQRHLRKFINESNDQKAVAKAKQQLNFIKQMNQIDIAMEQQYYSKHYTFGAIYFLPDSLYSDFKSGSASAMNGSDDKLHISEMDFEPITLIEPDEHTLYLKRGDQPIPKPLISHFYKTRFFERLFGYTFRSKESYMRQGIEDINVSLNKAYQELN